MEIQMPELTNENLQLFLVFVVPGFIALKTYALLVPGHERELSNVLVDSVTYSMVNLGLMSWALFLLRRDTFPSSHPIMFAFGSFGILVLSPCFLAISVYAFRKSKLARRWIPDPRPSGWDYSFEKRPARFILFHLRNGKLLGGLFAEASFASSFPCEPDIFVEQVWRVDEDGRFIEQVEGTAGCYLKYADCERIELFEAKELQ